MTMDPERGEENRYSIRKWILRLAAFLAVICLCAAAAIAVASQWQNARLKDLPEQEGVRSNLNAVQKFYIGINLAARAQELNQPVGSSEEELPFEITFGETAEGIAANLVEAGLLGDSELFLDYLQYHGLDSYLEAGRFLIDPQMTYQELAEHLTNAAIEEVELRFIEGWRLEEIANYLATVQPAQIDSIDFLDQTMDPNKEELSEYEFLSGLPDDASLEGFLFPDTYRVPVEADAEELIHLMLDNFDARLTPAARQAIGAQGLSIFEAVTLASVIQREAVVSSESPAIAGVFFNRLRDGIMLQADPTVQYALGYQQQPGTWWKSPLTAEDLNVESPYNTYRISGLPKGPIANPGLISLEAVAFPMTSDYYFFVADCEADVPGSHIFSKTFDEHLIYVERCRR